ncbi:MAG: FlgD immunoglobulin-like domain containing protein [Treponema sp.]|uniref:FlgD immunoglobulin-like domain containing protein n=1 Tax=Treponema sp. TaxID=166 RepID=UPI002A90F54C|nr:FlgD immunoglobulin-like domain containing protein [Treponema sp.]MDY6397650.1 FlgD immunoglobulin-like domain containing protein [Treponema sp.]
MQVRKFCVMLMVLATLLCGAWGNRFRWTNGDGDGVWTNYKNWEYYDFGSSSWKTIGDDTKDYPGYNGNTNDAQVFLNTDDYGNSDITISIPENLKITSLYIESDSDHSVTLTLSDGINFEINENLNLGNVSSNTDPVNLIITGAGTVSVTENIRCKNTATTTFAIENEAVIKAKSIVNEKKENGATVTVSGDGTGLINLPHQNDSPDNTITIDTSVSFSTSEAVPVNTDTYYWKNTPEDTAWTNSANWETVNGEPVRHYPGYKDGDTAVFDATTDKYGVNGFTVADSTYILTIKNNAGTNRISIASVAAGYKAPVELHSFGRFLFMGVGELENFIVESGGAQFGNTLTINKKLTIKSGTGTSVWQSGGALTVKDFENSGSFGMGLDSSSEGITATFSGTVENIGDINTRKESINFNGGYSGSGRLLLSSGAITFGTGTTNTVSNLAVSDTCKIQNNSDDAVILGDVTLPDTAKDVTFTGKFKSTGKFLASPAGTYFINGNVDFSNCTEFSINGSDTTGATVFFYNMDSTSRTFTTKSDMEFSNFYFAGNVNIDLNGTVKVNSKCMMSALEDYKQTSPYTATITGTGKLSAAATEDGDGALSFAAGSDEDKTPTSIRGTLVIDADVNCAQHFGHYRGKTVIINKDKKLTVGKDYRGFDGSNDEEFNEISINGTVEVTENFGAGEGKKAILKIGKYGNLTAGGSVLRATFVENSGIIELNGGSSVFSFGSYTGTDDNSVKIHGGSIICSEPENNGTIGSILFLAGITNISYFTPSDVDFKIGNVVIAENTSFSTDVNLAVSSTWVNNNTSGGFVANGKTVTFENSSSSEPINITVSKTTFYKAVFKSSTDFSSSNEFTVFECKTGDVSLIFRADQTVTDSLSLEGAENHFVSLSSPLASSIIVPKDSFSADYLKIDEKIIIKEGSAVSSGSHKAYSTDKTSVPLTSGSPEQSAYHTLFKNGWDLGYDFVYTWKGTTSAWSTDSNWDLEVAPGLSSKNTEGVKVLIPDGVGEWPQLYTAQVKLKSLTIGTSTSLSHDARIIINVDGTGASGGGSLNIENSDTTQPLLTNYGTIEYKGSSRIMNGTSPLNDTLNSGTIEYSGTSAQTVTKFASSAGEDDYANLLITGTDVSTADSIQVGENLSVSNKTSPAQNGVLKINEDLTLRGNLVIGGGCSFEVDTDKSVIFAGTGASAQELSVDSGVTKAEFANVKIESGAKVQSAGSYTVTGNWTNENSIDSGTGGFTASTGTITFTGSSLSITGKNNFNNLIFEDGAGGAITAPVTVSDTLKILNGTGNELSLSGENSFTGLVTIGDSANSLSGGKITLNSDGNLQLAEVTCDSLEVQSSVTFTENVASPVTFTGSGAQINGNEKTFSKAVTFSGPSATLNGNNTFSGTVTFSRDGITLSGDNTFNGNVTCATGGVTLTFADDSIQTIAGTSPAANLVLKGEAVSSRLTLSGNATIVVPKNTASRTYFEGEYLSIPSNLVITSDASSSQVDYGAYSVQNSVPSEPASPNEQDAYITLFKNGWDLGYTFSYVWTGDTDSSWSKKENWNIGIVPGISSASIIAGLSGKTTGAKVSIPDGLSNYPEVDVTGGVSVQSLEIGSSGGNPHNSSIKLTSNPVSVTQNDAGGRSLLTNFGTIEYTGAARIANGAATPLPINDATNNGTVLYSGGTQASPLEISTSASSGAAEADYANLVIKGIVSNPSPVTVSGPTLIELAPTAEISLVSANTFSGPVTIKSGNSIALIGANIFSGGVIVDAADSSVSLYCGQNFNLGNSATITKCKNLTLSSPAGISISAQNEINLSGALSLKANTTLSLGSKNLTFDSYSCAVDKSDTIEATSGGSITQTGATSSTIGKLNLTSGFSPYSLNGGTGGLAINSAVYGSSSISTSGNVTLAGTTSPDKIDVLKISAGKTILSGDNFVSSVEIDSGAVLQTGTASASTVHISVNGDWTNNAGESGFVANDGTVEFTNSATISGNNSFNKAVFDENMSFGGSNSFSEFVCESAGKSLTFAAGSNQTVTKLTIRGTDSGKINLTGIGEWQITPLNHAQISIAHAIITNSKNIDSEPIIVYAKNGYNTDGTGNTNWIFAGHKYIWTGAVSTDWNLTSNWNPASVPREYADVEIPGGKTNYPKLTQDLNLNNDEKIFVVDTNGDGINENESVTSSVAIDSGAVFDFAGNNLTVNALSSEGRIRVLGTEIIAASGDSGIKNLPLDSSSVLTGVIEYSGDFGTRETPNFGDKFSLLEFTAGAGGEISGSISVTGKTLISNGAGAALSLSGDNTFTGDVKITSAGNIVLKGKKDDSNPLALLGDVDCSKLNLKSDVVLNGNVTTMDSQDFEGKVFLDSGIIFNAGSSLVSFGADILSKSENSAITLESEVSLGGNVTTALSQTFKKNMTLLSDVVFTAGSGIKFDSASELSITSDKSAKFKSPVTSNCDLAITVPTVDFDLNASFKNTESTNSLSLKTGTSLSFKNAAFEAGKLIVEEGASFSQTGVNPSTAVQKVYGIENNGSCVWDSESKGGTLFLSGSISGTKAGEIIFNKKNVTLSATPITISGVFFDLTVPGGINATNGAGLVVRRNFIVEGAYLHNDQNLTLGTVSFADGRKYASANNEDGSAGLISCASSNLGNVTVVQETTRKKFATNIEGISFSLDDATADAGSVEFVEKFKSLSLTNAASTNFAILFDSSCEITNDVIFGTSGNVIFGTKEDSSCIFANSVEHTAGDSKLAGSVKAASAKFARSVLTQNTKIDCDSNSVIFTDDVDSDSSDTPRALSIGTESSATSVKFEKSAGTSNPLASLLVYGTAEFGGNLVSEGIINLKGDILAFADVNLLSKNSYILADGSASRTFGATSGSLTFASELFVDIDSSSTVTISSDLTWQKILCAYSGKISAGAVNLSGTNLVLFGSSYSADDPRYSGSDSRFAYFGYESLAYKPSSGTAGFKAEFSTIGTKVLLSENFYANGLDFAGCSFEIPNQSASNPLFNSTSAVTEKQWGIPYAVVFNSEIANCSAGSSEGAAFVTAAKNQNVTDRSGNSGFQFAVPQISGAYSVSDSVVCLSFDMSLENSNGEVSSTISLVSSLENGGIFYSGKSLAFDGKFYTESDGTNCSVPLSESNLALTDIPAHTPLYLKVSSAQNNWNTDATATFAGTEDSTDRSGIHRNRTTDLSLFEGLFFAAEGKTMCRNYGIGLWSGNDSGYTDAKIFATIDKARPVLVDFFAGQELHSKNTGLADSQKFYDSHNFVELRYSEPVDIGNLLAGATEQNQNQQAQTDFDSAEKHGGAITNNSGSDGMTISGFVSIEKGELTAGYKSGSAGSYSFNSDTNKCHALYRKFSKNAGEAEKVFPNRIRISVAGYVDEENPVSLGGSDFHNWIGYIDSSSSPAGAVVPLANRFITDLAVDSDGLPLKNIFDENNSSRSLSVNDRASTSSSSLYGEWDCSHPVFAAYVTNFNGSDPNVSWINGDGENRQYEMLGTVDSNTNAYIDTIEMHLFDNTQNYSADDEYKWIARKGWISSGGNVIPGFEAPESSGGSRAIPSSSAMTLGGIRRSSLDGAISAFTYKYSLDGVESDFRTFAEKDIAQHVKSPLFRVESLSETFTDNDEPYLGLTINPMDSKLPIRTTFTVTYEPKKSFITDLAGNRLIQTDSGSDKKILHSIDITPPSFTMTISPVGENKIYAVFTKPLAYKGTYLSDLGNELPSVLQKISSNLEFVYSEDDNVDTSAVLSGDKAISVVDAELAKGTSDYTAILFTLDRKISLDDVEKIWIRVNDSGEGSETLFGNITASYIQDKLGNPVPVHTCHALSDFAVNAVNMLYAYSDITDDDGWDEHEIYGQGLAPESSDYAVHDFSEDGKNYNRVRLGRDIVFQFEFIDSDSERSKTGVQNGEALSLVYDEKANIRSEWKSSKYNLLTGSDWRIWLDNPFEAFSLSFNSSPLSASLPSPPSFADVEGSDILKNMIWKNEDFNIEAGKEYQFFFKILDSSGNVIQINHDGDTRTPRIPLYTFRMPKERISAGDFSYLDLWSFTTRDLTRQRGGVTILNNVINAAIGEKTAIEVNMKNDGNLNVFVMTLDGNIIKRLSKGSVKSGTHYFYWDGKNGAGNPVARGLYFVRVSGSGIDETRKVMVVK